MSSLCSVTIFWASWYTILQYFSVLFLVLFFNGGGGEEEVDSWGMRFVWMALAFPGMKFVLVVLVRLVWFRESIWHSLSPIIWFHKMLCYL